MSQVNTLLSQRTQKSAHAGKMAEMATLSASGKRTSLSAIFAGTELSVGEKSEIEELLHRYAIDDERIVIDLPLLVAITSEVKAINNQAALLHGERIKRAQEVLLNYQEGAFTAWLIKTYGNRQTPYNFLRYHLFHEQVPVALRPQLEAMPRQAVYTLASREAGLEEKQRFIKEYRGETKMELLQAIRSQFPIESHDRRRRDSLAAALISLEKATRQLELVQNKLKGQDKGALKALLDRLHLILAD